MTEHVRRGVEFTHTPVFTAIHGRTIPPVVPQSSPEPFADLAAEPAVRGFVHLPDRANGDALVLTHGAGANCQSKLLVAMADAFAEAGFTVLRCDLPFRQARPHGPPFPAFAARDREGLRRAVHVIGQRVRGRIFLGGHSYGGRQATMLVADSQLSNGLERVAGLLLLSYPLHPLKKPAELRTGHFPKFQTPALFVHGARDPFGSFTEMKSALELIPARTALVEIEGAGHDLSPKAASTLQARIVEAFSSFFQNS
jgi:predicted alpha/beta-hydrolase family hydrolase